MKGTEGMTYIGYYGWLCWGFNQSECLYIGQKGTEGPEGEEGMEGMTYIYSF